MMVLSLAASSAIAAGEFTGFDGRISRSAAAPTASAPALAESVSAAAKAAPKEWTVMVFINGKNDLELAGLYNVNQMEKIGSTSKMNIVVEQGRMKGQEGGDTDLDGDWTGARRMLIRKTRTRTR